MLSRISASSLTSGVLSNLCRRNQWNCNQDIWQDILLWKSIEFQIFAKDQRRTLHPIWQCEMIRNLDAPIPGEAH